jgi:hypothetical protein
MTSLPMSLKSAPRVGSRQASVSIVLTFLFLLKVKTTEICRIQAQRTKSLPLTTGASTTAAPIGASGSSQAGASSHGDPALAHAHSQAQLGSLSQAIAGCGGQSSQASGGLTTYPTNNFSHSDSGIDGTFNKFLDKICFPCGHFYEDT